MTNSLQLFCALIINRHSVHLKINTYGTICIWCQGLVGGGIFLRPFFLTEDHTYVQGILNWTSSSETGEV